MLQRHPRVKKGRNNNNSGPSSFSLPSRCHGVSPGGTNAAKYPFRKGIEAWRLYEAMAIWFDMFGGFHKWGYPQIILILIGFSTTNYKPSAIYGNPHLIRRTTWNQLGCLQAATPCALAAFIGLSLKKTRIYHGGYQMENVINPIIDHPLNHHKWMV